MYEIDWCATPCVQISVVTEVWESCWWYCNKQIQLYQGSTWDFHSSLPTDSCLLGICFMALFSTPTPLFCDVKSHLPSLAHVAATANIWATHLTIQRKDAACAWGGNKWRILSPTPPPWMEWVLLPPQSHTACQRGHGNTVMWLCHFHQVGNHQPNSIKLLNPAFFNSYSSFSRHKGSLSPHKNNTYYPYNAEQTETLEGFAAGHRGGKCHGKDYWEHF